MLPLVSEEEVKYQWQTQLAITKKLQANTRASTHKKPKKKK